MSAYVPQTYSENLDRLDGNAAAQRTALSINNVDNTSDANKPISSATQTALDAKAASSHNHSASEITSGELAKARQNAQTAYLDASDQTFVGINRFGATDIYRVGQFRTETGGDIEFGLLGWSSIGMQSLSSGGNFQTLNMQPNGGAVSVGGALSVAGDATFNGITNIGSVDIYRVGRFRTPTGGDIEFGLLGGSSIGMQSLNSGGSFQTLVLQPNGGALSVGGATILNGSTKLGIKTIATLPSAASSSGERYQVSDSATIANRIAFSNGSAWYYEGTAVAV